MQTHFDKELGELKEALSIMASHAEQSVRDAVDALINRNEALALQVRQKDEIIDQYELKIDEMAVRLLAKAPLATNLRLITVAMKVSHNLERVGDEAKKIARRTLDLLQDAPLKQTANIPALAGESLRLLKAALDALSAADPAAARPLIAQDKAVDSVNREICDELALQMVAAPETVNRGLNLMLVSRGLERIADHAKNIAEEVVYLYDAEDIRHRPFATAA